MTAGLLAIAAGTGSQPADLSWLWAALIGVGGAVGGALGGGIVGGRYVLRASADEFERDRAADRIDRSRNAAIAIAGEAERLRDSVRAWRTGGDADALADACSVYYRASFVQVLLISNPDVADRIADHAVLSSQLADVAKRDKNKAAVLANAVDEHTNALAKTVTEYVLDRPLPVYPPLPAGESAALVKWVDKIAEVNSPS
jgi:hypothetical protein